MKPITEYSLTEIQQYLSTQVTSPITGVVKSAAVAGLGNMNHTLRIETDSGSIILKQAVPHCARYPSIPAPVERVKTEFVFYSIAKKNPALDVFFPKVYFYDPLPKIMALEDLGSGGDLSWIYIIGEKRAISNGVVEKLVHFLELLHSTQNEGLPIDNMPMRSLNHDYIFLKPFDPSEPPPSNLEGKLRETAVGLKNDSSLRSRIRSLGDVYLERGTDLCHGDFHPGSWLSLKSSDDVRVIDCEFGFHGRREFDIGILIAHLIMSHYSLREVEQFISRYALRYDHVLAKQFAGIEIARRLLHVATPPLSADENTRLGWLSLGLGWI